MLPLRFGGCPAGGNGSLTKWGKRSKGGSASVRVFNELERVGRARFTQPAGQGHVDVRLKTKAVANLQRRSVPCRFGQAILVNLMK